MPCEENRRDEASSSNREANRALWKGIWKMSTPGKIKHFLWKACSNALPVKTNLVKRKSQWKMSVRSVPRKSRQLPTPYRNVRCCRRCGVQNLDWWTETKQGMVHSVKVQHLKARRRTSYKHQIRRSKHGLYDRKGLCTYDRATSHFCYFNYLLSVHTCYNQL